MKLRRSCTLLLLAPLFALLTTSLIGCGTVKKGLSWRPFKKKPAVEEKTQKDLYLGTVEMVNPEQRFVLIRSELRMTFPAGTRLQSRSKTGSKTDLILTPERKMSFISADIKEGFPQAGDTVVIPFAEPAASAAIAGTPMPGTAAPASGHQPALPAGYVPTPGQLPSAEASAPPPGPPAGPDDLPPPIR